MQFKVSKRHKSN